MTATTLEIRKKIDKRIAILSPEQLYGLLFLLDSFITVPPVSPQENVSLKSDKGLPPRNPKYGGRRISDEIAAMFLTGPENHDTDEDVDEKIWEYIKEKYK